MQSLGLVGLVLQLSSHVVRKCFKIRRFEMNTTGFSRVLCKLPIAVTSVSTMRVEEVSTFG
jgi:hypothetical protein